MSTRPGTRHQSNVQAGLALVTLVAGLLTLRPPSALAAGAGGFDTTFNLKGWDSAPFGGRTEHINAVAVASDAKIVVAGGVEDSQAQCGWGFVRYNPDGSRDSGFGTYGPGQDFVPCGLNRAGGPQGMVVQPDDRIVAVGMNDFAAIRLLPSGQLDPSFGNGGEVFVHPPQCCSHAKAVALQPGGKILIAGDAIGEVLPGWGDIQEIAVARLLSDGDLDPGFGTGGMVLLTVPPPPGRNYPVEAASPSAIKVDSEGRIVVVGCGSCGGYNDEVVARLASDGTLDPTFGGTGAVVTPAAGCCGNESGGDGLAVGDSGQIYVTGADSAGLRVRRYLDDGTLDTTFGQAGRSEPGVTGSPGGIALQTDGRVVAGARYPAGGDFTVVRYQKNGELDPTFGSGGVSALTFDGVQGGVITLTLQTDGRIIAAGGILSQADSGHKFVVARLLAGSSPPAFDSPPSPTPGSTVPATVGRFLTIHLQASDPDGEGVSITGATTPTDMSCSFDPGNPADGTCTWLPGLGDVGVHDVSFFAADASGDQATLSFSMDVVMPPPASVTRAWVEPVLQETPLWDIDLAVSVSNVVCPAWVTVTLGHLVQTTAVCGSGQQAPNLATFTRRVFQSNASQTLKPGSQPRLAASIRDARASASNAFQVTIPHAPAWVAIGDSFSSGHHQDADRPSPLCMIEWIAERIPACEFHMNDPNFSWVHRAVRALNLHVPREWRISEVNIAKSGTPTTDFGDTQRDNPGTDGWAAGGQVGEMQAKLQTTSDSWNIVSISGGANDASFDQALVDYYKQHSKKDSTPPWDVKRQDECPTTKAVYLTAFKVNDYGHRIVEQISIDLQEIVKVATQASQGVRVLDLLYPYVLSSDNVCQGGEFGAGAVVDLLDGAHQKVAPVFHLDLRTAFTGFPLTDLQLTRFWGYPHPNSWGQGLICERAVVQLVPGRDVSGCHGPPAIAVGPPAQFSRLWRGRTSGRWTHRQAAATQRL